MFFYRVKQFFWSLYSNINEEDIKYLEIILNKEELKLFNKLAKSEQKHSINVSKDVKLLCLKKGINSGILVKVSLLHDIGKTEKRVNIINKSIIVILDSITKGKLKKFYNIKDIDVYYNHGKMGVEILKKFGYSSRFLYLIENHHNEKIVSDTELNIIKICDNKN
ncbi:HDIG domain-containing metalloprotein [Clostridium akagii]|uniref:HDIG domain-containing metalloprotein n=1 Tax=Clostridium akagii TaxID=91623 RepID=UPI00047B109F|nr:HDIG domain-containing metalloprotein [Clostridium akagii]